MTLTGFISADLKAYSKGAFLMHVLPLSKDEKALA